MLALGLECFFFCYIQTPIRTQLWNHYTWYLSSIFIHSLSLGWLDWRHLYLPGPWAVNTQGSRVIDGVCGNFKHIPTIMRKPSTYKNFSGMYKKSLNVCYPTFFITLTVICCDYLRQGYWGCLNLSQVSKRDVCHYWGFAHKICLVFIYYHLSSCDCLGMVS